MKHVFEQVVDALPHSLEDLADEYDIEYLPEMYEAKEQGLILANLEGLTITEIDIHDRDCVLTFTYRDDLGTEEEPMEGFQLDLFDEKTGELLVTCFHASSGEWPERFDISGGNFLTVDDTDPDVTPWVVLAALTCSEETGTDDDCPEDDFDDGFPANAITSPHIH